MTKTDELLRRMENATIAMWPSVGAGVIDRFLAELNAKPDIDLFDIRFSWMEPSWLDRASALLRRNPSNIDAPYRTRRAIAASQLSTSERMEIILMVTR